MKTRNIIMIVAVVLIFLVGGGLAIYAAVRHEQTAGTEEFFSGMDEGFVDSENAWDHTPLTVGCTNYAGGMDDCEHVSRTAIVINERLGFEMFRYHGADSTADVLVVLGVPSSGDERWEAGGYAELLGQGRTYNLCLVETSNTGTVELMQLTLHHEMGCHCLGLEHDESETSICRPVQTETPMGAFPPHLSDHDRALLRGKYNR